MNKKGFSLLEILLVFFAIVLIFFLSIPIVISIITKSRLNSYKISSANVIDALDYYLTQNGNTAISENGIDVTEIDESILKNNDFESGLIKLNKDDNIELVYLKKGDYCSKGTKGNIKVTNKGCGALDETAPTEAYVFFKSSNNDSITVVASGYDPDSKIIKYELSVDNKKYIKNDDENYNVFNVEIDDNNEHEFKVRITNEAGLTFESEIKMFKKDFSFICNLEDKINCPLNYYSVDLENFSNDKIDYNENKNYYIDNNYNYHLVSINNIDNTLKSSTPILDDEMIPVIYDSTTNKWIKANPNQIYYDYENKNWANAVIVRKNKDLNDEKSKDRDYYLSDEAIYEEVYEKDILLFYVWIPKYSYKLWNINGSNDNPVSIDIMFENTVKNDNKLEKNGLWYTHNAFLYNNINGFWISKYLVSADENSSCYAFKNSDNCNLDNYHLKSIPSSNYLNNVDLLNASVLVNKIKSSVYGLSENTDSHLPTNLEWSSVLYLAHSKYGVNDNIKTSSTGNETGVYYNPEVYEMVMANYNQKVGKLQIENWPTYIDYYNGITNKSRIIGDATLETDKWYNTKNSFVNGENPFIIRGGGSLFSYNGYNGSYSANNYFRAVLYVMN